MRTKVYAQLGRSGMCNRLFIWAHAYVFSINHHLPLYVNGWYNTPIGPWLRNEKNKRFYAFYFKYQIDLIGYALTKIRRKNILYNPGVEEVLDPVLIQAVVFNNIPHYSRYFQEIKGYHDIVVPGFYNMLASRIRKRIQTYAAPQIGVHVRRGDFAFNPLRESLQFYVEAIKYVRSRFGADLSVTIFSDGYENELTELLDLENVELFNSKTDIEDLIVLSKSEYIITSLGSTYSYWAAFLSEATIIHSSKFEYQPIRWSKLVSDQNLLIEAPDNINSIVPSAIKP